MKGLIATLVGLSTIAVQAASIPSQSAAPTVGRRNVCSGNTADDRSVWCDYDLYTDYYNEVPDTGVTREYWFEVTNSTLGPDGFDRIVLSINGTVPGPTLIGDWGDTFIVHVTNSLSNNGTGIHFHGIRQNLTNQHDGVPSITQCPTAPGDSITYTWRATQYGSSWYHSHYSLQAWNGVFGGILIRGPASANYDEDLGILFLNDWDHNTVDYLYNYAQVEGPPTLDTGLINGTNTWDDDSSGSFWETTFSSGTSYLLRLVNGAVDTHFDFFIDNHTFTVIANDFVPIVPYTATRLSIGMGQRYDIVVNANMSDVASDFWLRAIPDSFCSDNDNSKDIKGIIHYDSSTSTPTTEGWDYDQLDCFGELPETLVPYLALDASTSADLNENLAVAVGRDDANLYKWTIGGTSMQVEWANPSALQIINNSSDWTDSSGVIECPDADTWSIIIIQTSNSVPHPIHLHGHDFYQLAQGEGTYESASPTLQTTNPPRRDVTMLPASGYVVIAFLADNPGAWLCHCHIGWHTEEGFALQFIERYDEIAALYDQDVLQDTCDAWELWADEVNIEDEGSGV